MRGYTRATWMMLSLVVWAAPVLASPPLPEEVEVEKPWSLDVSLDYASQYFFRGYNLNPGADLILQPGAEFHHDLLSSDDWTLSGYVAVWANFADKSGPRSLGSFYEFDVYGGLNFDYGHFSFGTIYTHYSYPNGSYGQQQEIGFTVGYDDSDLWTDVPVLASLSPRVGYFFELEDRGDSDRNEYAEIGLTPEFRPLNVFGRELVLRFPMAVGLSGDGYFTDGDGKNETFGYYVIGAEASVALDVIPESLGEWSVIVGVDYVRLLSDSTQEANGGDEDDFVFRLGLAVSF